MNKPFLFLDSVEVNVCILIKYLLISKQASKDFEHFEHFS